MTKLRSHSIWSLYPLFLFLHSHTWENKKKTIGDAWAANLRWQREPRSFLCCKRIVPALNDTTGWRTNNSRGQHTHNRTQDELLHSIPCSAQKRLSRTSVFEPKRNDIYIYIEKDTLCNLCSLYQSVYSYEWCLRWMLHSTVPKETQLKGMYMLKCIVWHSHIYVELNVCVESRFEPTGNIIVGCRALVQIMATSFRRAANGLVLGWSKDNGPGHKPVQSATRRDF